MYGVEIKLGKSEFNVIDSVLIFFLYLNTHLYIIFFVFLSNSNDNAA